MFRGLFQRLLERRYSFVAAAVISACLFGLWHIIGPARSYYDKSLSCGGMIANMVMLAVTSGLPGFMFAMMTKLTGSLYMAMGHHFINNTVVNMLHVISDTGADELMVVRIFTAQAVSFLVVLIWFLRSPADN